MNSKALNTLKEEWEKLSSTEPRLRIRDAAKRLGVSEAELLASKTGDTVIKLVPEFKAILGEVEKLGKVMALTRNEQVVHERKGIYLNPTLKEESPVGLFVGEDIDLRVFFHNWTFAFAVIEQVKDDWRRSLQFFAHDGSAIHKIYLTSSSDILAFDSLVDDFRAEEQNPTLVVTGQEKEEVVEVPDEEIELESFRKGWVELKDTHDFFGLLKKYKLSRTQALRLAPEGNYAVKVQALALRKVIEKSAEVDLSIMVFVGNEGMIQIHTGPVKKLFEMGDWFNVMDPDFNLHIRETEITDVWIVRKPTTDGMVTALECFNAKGEQVVQLFGKRKPGIPELTEWRDLIQEIESEMSELT